MIRHYTLLEKDGFPALVGKFLESTLKGEVPTSLNVTGQLRPDELSARRGSKEADRLFSLVSLSVLTDSGTSVVAQDAHSGKWVKISPESNGFVIQEVM